MSQYPLRPNVCMLLVNRENKVFLGERHGSAGVWQLPQGGVDEGETLEENALRELHEELGVDSELLETITQLEATHSYEFDKPRSYGGTKYRGQSQNFFLVRFKGQDSDIQLDRFEQELSDFQWCELSEVCSKAEAKRVPGYKAPLKEAREILSKS